MPEFHQVTDPERAIAAAKADAARHKAAKEAPMNAAKAHAEASKAAASGAEFIATSEDHSNVQRFSYQRPPGLAFESRSGSPVSPSDAQPESVVYFGDVTSTSVAAAELQGFIERGPNGWQLTAKGKEVMSGEPAGPSSDLAPGGSDLDEDGGDHLQEGADSGNTEHDKDAAEPSEAVAKAAEVLKEVPDRILERESSRAVLGDGIDLSTVAADLGITEDEARERAAAVVNGYQVEAAKYLATVHGIEHPEEFAAWAEAHRPTEFQGAKFGQVRGGQLEAYDVLVPAFKTASAKLDAMDLARFEGSHEVEGHDEPAQVWKEDGAFWFHHPAIGTLSLREALLRKIAQPQ